MKQVRPPQEKREVLLSEHRIILDNVRNIRDISGYRNEDGKRLLPGKLIRSGALAGATMNDLRLLTDKYKVRTVIDFRSVRESAHLRDPEIPGVKYFNLPVLVPETEKNSGSFPSESAIYAEMLFGELANRAYKRFFELLLTYGDKTVLFHDDLGKDETGVAAALLLSVLGFHDNLIIEEYMLSGKDPEIHKLTEMRPGLTTAGIISSHPLEYALTRVQIEYGSITEYVKKTLYVSNEDIRRLKKLFLA